MRDGGRAVAASQTTTKHHCTASDLSQRGAIPLPVLATAHHPTGTIRKSKSGKRRAVVLATVQGLIIAHVVLWLLSRKYGWWGGRTTTPIEPSESMEFVKHGVVNAGLIFFVLALLSTLIFGRWFCGWGCHVVMLQDLCSWMMKKMGVRPKPFRSRLLIYVPLVLALYMFVWPAFYRLAIAPWIQPDLVWPGFSVQLTTTEFWKTFPYSWLIVVPFLGICGFAAVYFLGSKGFCTYGCPYGGFFAPLDEFAVGRIRVTDACEQCGHCTAVCTSNVRVHEEVREYGMVVDPGCMKCLDCVSVCPNDALYFGFGKPAQLKGPAKTKTPKKKYDLTWPEEIGLSVVFLWVFLSVRGVYGLVPMLMAAGIAGVITYLAWKLWRLVRNPSVRFHQFQLKSNGSLRRPGWLFGASVALLLVLTAHSGAVSAAFNLAQYHGRRVTMPPEITFSGAAVRMPEEMTAHADKALRLYRFASTIGEGGIGLAPFWQSELDMRMAKLLSTKLEFAQAERLLRNALRRDGRREAYCSGLAWVLRAQLRLPEALAYYAHVLTDELSYTSMLDDYLLLCRQEGLLDEAIEVCRRRLELDPGNLHTMRRLSLLLLDTGQIDEAADLVRRTIDLDPDNPGDYSTLALALARQGDNQRAYEAMTRALELAPDDVRMNREMAGLLQALGRSDEAQAYLDRAQQLQLLGTHTPPGHRH